MKRKYLLIAVACIFATACQDNHNVVLNDVAEPASSHFEQALQDVMAIVAETNPKKYQHLASIKSTLRPEFYTSATMTECLPAPMRKKASSDDTANRLDTLLYIVNFGNEEGFAIMSANPEILGDMVFVVADSGSISMDDFVETTDTDYTLQPSKAIGSMIDGYIGGLTDLHKKNDHNNPTEYHPVQLPDYDYKYGEWNYLTKLDPLVKIKIGQRYPYNKYCFTRWGDSAVAGCVAIALIQIMSANQYPTTIGDRKIDWPKLVANYKTDSVQQDLLAYIIATIGKECKMKYGIMSSSTGTSNAVDCLNNYPLYTNVTLRMDYTFEDIEDMLLEARPIYIRGVHKGAFVGHAWTIDGWLQQQRLVQWYLGTELVGSKIEKRKLVHCVYGWNGKCDGYYHMGLFKVASQGPVEREENEADYPSKDGEYDFTESINIITYQL